MDRTERFYLIDALLRQAPGITRTRLCAEIGISRATLTRDIAYMRDRLFAPIVFDKDGEGYRFDPAQDPDGRYALPGLWFNPTEIHALLAMQQLLHDVEPGLLEPKVKPLKRRLEKLLDSGRYPAQEVAARVRLVPMAKRRAAAGRAFQIVADALLSRRRLDVTHHNRHTGETLARELSPQRLVYYRDNWYLDAWCHARDDLRSFSVDAIERARVLDAAAHEVGDDALAARFDTGYGIFSSPAGMKWAALRFDAYKARWVAQEQWHPMQRATPLPDGGLLLEVPFHDTRELAMDVLRHGGDCEVLGPPELRTRVLDEARALVERHAGAPSQPSPVPPGG